MRAFCGKHGGGEQGETTPNHTSYRFHLDPEHLKDALDRFGATFRCPTFDPEQTNGEIKRVNGEYADNNKVWNRVFEAIECATTDPQHPWSMHKSGNLATFGDPDQRDTDAKIGEKIKAFEKEVPKFFEQWYQPNIMTLVVLGKGKV